MKIFALHGISHLIDYYTITMRQQLTLTLPILIGNGDMHLKNWSLLYPDGRTPKLAPAYDFVSTIPYIPNDRLALDLSGTKDMAAINITHFKKLAAKAHVPEFLTKKTVNETIEAVHEIWSQKQQEYPLPQELLGRINQHIKRLKLV